MKMGKLNRKQYITIEEAHVEEEILKKELEDEKNK